MLSGAERLLGNSLLSFIKPTCGIAVKLLGDRQPINLLTRQVAVGRQCP